MSNDMRLFSLVCDYQGELVPVVAGEALRAVQRRRGETYVRDAVRNLMIAVERALTPVAQEGATRAVASRDT